MLYQVIFAITATLCFGIIFNIKKRQLLFTSLAGGVGWFTYLNCIKMGYPVTFSYFFSAVALTLFSEIFARYLKTPVTSILICGLIPLVPGGGLYYTMYNVIQEKPLEAFSKGLETFLISGAISLGIVFVTTFMKIIKDLRK